jgi:hypothetical protein
MRDTGVRASRHRVRRRADELVAMVKQHPHLILTPNLPDRGVAVGMVPVTAWMVDR